MLRRLGEDGSVTRAAGRCDLSIATVPSVVATVPAVVATIVAPVMTPANTVRNHRDSPDGGGGPGHWVGSDHSAAPHASSG